MAITKESIFGSLVDDKELDLIGQPLLNQSEHQQAPMQPPGGSLFGQVFGEAIVVPVPPPITAWSYSRLRTYNECPRRAKYQFVDKVPEKENEAIVRGKAVHTAAAEFIGTGKLAPTQDVAINEAMVVLSPWKSKLQALHDMGSLVEKQAAFDVDWEQVDWFSRRAYLRVVFDVIVPPRNKHVLVIDFKTGKKRDEHKEQLSLYAAGAHALYPTLDHNYEVCFVYLDHPHLAPMTESIHANQMANVRAVWEAKAAPMLRETVFPTKAGPQCRWCPYAKTKGGPCEQG